MMDDIHVPVIPIHHRVDLIKTASPDLGELSDEEQKELNILIENAKAKQGIVEFTDEEIKTMPKTFKRLIIIQKKRCRLRTHASGKNTITYEIRFRREGYDISASGVTLQLAKENFIKKLKTARPKDDPRHPIIPTTFTAFSLYFFENFRKEKVTAQTYNADLGRLKKHLHPYFKEKQLKKITPTDCKELLARVKNEGKSKTAEELFSIMSIIFKGAIAHALIERNPLDTVLRVTHERESGTALTKAEENALLNAVKGSIFEHAVALALFCGLRPNELPTAQLRGKFIVAVNSKRKTKKTEYKRIPVIDKMRQYIPEDGKFYIPTIKSFRNKVKDILPNHKLYDLRTTFYSRCKECNVSEYALKEYAGHSLGALGNAYTDLSDDYLLEEGKKLNLW